MLEALIHKPRWTTGGQEEFLTLVSHELRTPIMAILGWAELLDRKTADQADVAQAVRVIKRNAQLQVRLVEDLLDYSRITTNRLSLTIHAVSLEAIIAMAIDAILPIARKKRTAVVMEPVASASELDGDSLRLQQVFSNLLSNSVKFTPDGGSVNIKLETAGDYHTATVSDTGEGISAEFLPFIFARDRQALRPDTALGGLGLGLMIAQHIVELHGGTIQAASGGKGQGAVFAVRLPRRKASGKLSMNQ
jgi:signal transduction histidine kinase